MAEQLHPEDIYQTLEYEIVTLEAIARRDHQRKSAVQTVRHLAHTGARCPAAAGTERLCADHSCKGTIVTPINLGYRGSDRIPAHSR